MAMRWLLIVGIVLIAAACSKKEELGDAAAGRALAERNCQRCHAIGATGDSPVAEAPPFREVVKRWSPNDLAEFFGEGNPVGHGREVDMPEFIFEPKDIDDLIAYLNTLKTKS